MFLIKWFLVIIILLALIFMNIKLLADIEFQNKPSFPSLGWSLFKPKSNILTYHFKGSKAEHLTVYYSEKWLERNLLQDQDLKNSIVNNYFNSDLSYIIWPDNNPSNHHFVNEIIKNISNKGDKGCANILKLKSQTMQFILRFVEVYRNENLQENYIQRPKKEFQKILKVEQFLNENLTNSFIGLEELAAKFNMSVSKLKTDFKLQFGESIFQYFQRKQMLLAKEILIQKDIRISELADMFGYENVSKFSQAFKKHHGVLPSEILIKSPIL
jgi:AraC-like DNA-binding protein